MITVRKSDIPDFLQSGELYRTLVENNDDPGEELTFPASVLKSDTSVNNVQDLNHLLSSLQYWAVDDCTCQEVVDFVVVHHSAACADVLQNFATAFPYVKCLHDVMLAESHCRVALAIHFGSMHILQALDRWRGGVPPCPYNAGMLAAMMNRCDILAHVYDKTSHRNDSIGAIACARGHVDILRFLVEHGYEVSITDVQCFVAGGHLNCLEYVHATQPIFINTHCMVWLYHVAVSHGHQHILQFLYHIKPHANGVDLVAGAARHGHLNCLLFLHEQGCPFHENTTAIAAINGHSDCLQYAVEHGCPMHPNTSRVVAEYGNLDCLIYAHQHGSPISRDSSFVDQANPCWTYWNENVTH